MKRIILFIGIVMVLLIGGCEDKPDIELGTIVDFTISAGGFGHSDRITVSLDNGMKYVLTNTDFHYNNLRIGNKLCAVDGNEGYLFPKKQCKT